jgi:hypothetical protein
MRRRTAATHADPNALELLADCAPMNAQLGTDLAQAPTLGVQVGCTLNVHGATVASKRWHAAHYCGASPNFRSTAARFCADRWVSGWSSPRGCWPK